MGSNAPSSTYERLRKQYDCLLSLNPAFHAFSHIASWEDEPVRRLAAEATSGGRSPIHGLSVSIKGNIPVAGLPWSEGSAAFARRIASVDGEIVRRIRQAGGVLFGMTSLSEFAMYGVRNDFETMGLNPWDAARTAGGSSTGAGVAAALGLCDINIGTDSGGSIRNPACHCGVVGFMPRIGALPDTGQANYTPSLSSNGIIARDVARVSSAYWTLSGDRPPAEIKRRLLVPRDLVFAMADEATSVLFEEALESLSNSGIELTEWRFSGWDEAEAAAGIVSLGESSVALRGFDVGEAGEAIRARALVNVEDAQMQAARAAMARFRRQFADAVEQAEADAVVTPTWPFPAPLIDATTTDIKGVVVPLDPRRNCFVRAANAIDACAISLPMGIYPDCGVPAGLHLMAPGGHKSRLLAIASTVEEILPPIGKPPADL